MTAMPAWTAAGRKLPALLVGVIVTLAGVPIAAHLQSQPATPDPASPRALVDTYCLSCHSTRVKTAGLDLELLNLDTPGANAETWEKIIAKLRAGSMPPPGRPRPDTASYHAVASRLEQVIDRAWDAKPD